MFPLSILPYTILIFIIVGGIIFYFSNKLTKKGIKKTGKFPKGHFMAQGIGIGMGLGIPIGLALGNIALGPAIGAAIGVAIGTSLEKKHSGELREPSKEELKLKQYMIYLLTGMLVLGIFIIFYFMKI